MPVTGDKAAGDPETRGWLVPLGVTAALSVFFGVAATILVRKHPVGLGQALGIYFSFCLLLGLCIVPAFDAPRLWVGHQLRRFGPTKLIAPIFTTPYLLYALSTGDFRWAAFAKILALILLPVVLYSSIPVRYPERLNWQDAVAWLWWMVPTVLRLTSGIWRVPVNLDFMTRLLIVGIASWSWVILRPIPNIGYEPRLNMLILRAIASNVFLFAAIALPLALAVGFVQLNPRWKGVWPFAFDYTTILLFIAILEELFFRGALLRLLGPTLHSTRYARVASSIIFGLSHVLYAPAPNWTYVLLASVAGWFYGRAYEQAQNLTAPIVAHALIDTLWRAWFGRGAGSLVA
jgi:membrane protease YdiL (CAAX protease family)